MVTRNINFTVFMCLFSFFACNSPSSPDSTVTFNTNGGSLVISQSVPNGATAKEPPTPTKTGYTFTGWYSDAGFTTVFNFATPITASTTLYAKWTINQYNVIFNANGGSAVAPQTVNYSAFAIAPSTPTKTGFTFAGWYSDVGFTSPFNFATPITASITLYAKWTNIEQIKFANSDVTGWSVTGQNGVTVEFGNKDTSAFRALIDGGADEYFIPGILQGMVQNLHGPRSDPLSIMDSSTKDMVFYAMLYASDSNATQMFNIRKNTWANKTTSLSMFDTSTAIGYLVLGGASAAGHFNHFFAQLTVTNVPDSAESVNIANQMLQIIKQKAGM